LVELGAFKSNFKILTTVDVTAEFKIHQLILIYRFVAKLSFDF